MLCPSARICGLLCPLHQNVSRNFLNIWPIELTTGMSTWSQVQCAFGSTSCPCLILSYFTPRPSSPPSSLAIHTSSQGKTWTFTWRDSIKSPGLLQSSGRESARRPLYPRYVGRVPYLSGEPIFLLIFQINGGGGSTKGSIANLVRSANPTLIPHQEVHLRGPWERRRIQTIQFKKANPW